MNNLAEESLKNQLFAIGVCKPLRNKIRQKILEKHLDGEKLAETHEIVTKLVDFEEKWNYGDFKPSCYVPVQIITPNWVGIDPILNVTSPYYIPENNILYSNTTCYV